MGSGGEWGTRQAQVPGLKPLESIGFIQGAEAPCSLPKDRSKGKGKCGDPSTAFGAECAPNFAQDDSFMGGVRDVNVTTPAVCVDVL